MAIIKNTTTINFGNNTISTSSPKNNYPWALVGVEVEGVTFTGAEGGLDNYNDMTKSDYASNSMYNYAITIGDMKDHNENGDRLSTKTNGVKGSLTIDGGQYFAGGTTCVYVANGTLTINGGTFFSQIDKTNRSKSEAEKAKYGDYRVFLLNCYDDNYPSKAYIKVNGGTFIGFDPAESYADGGVEGVNLVTPGHKSVKTGKYQYMVKDTDSDVNGTLQEFDVYEVVDESDAREGIVGTNTYTI